MERVAMSIGTFVVLAIVAALLVCAMRSLVRKGGSDCAGCAGGCGSSSCSSCKAVGCLLEDMERADASEALSEKTEMNMWA